MRHLCPTCRRSFDEAGFCPFDGTSLASEYDKLVGQTLDGRHHRPLAFHHVGTGALGPARRRRWPRLLLLALLAGGAAGAVAHVLGSEPAVVAGRARDAGPVAQPADAGTVQAPVDAEVDPDAAELVVVPAPDAGRFVRPAVPHDAGAPGLPEPTETPNHRGTVLVPIFTRPEDATLYDGTHYRGPGGTELEEPLGQKLVITCRHPGYKPGTVEVSFRNGAPAALCVMQRIKICIHGIKNPFDDCEVDPTAKAPRPTLSDAASPVDPTTPSEPSRP